MPEPVDLPESAPDATAADASTPPSLAADAAQSQAPWPREPVSAQRLRDAHVAQAQATLKRELVRVYAQSCGAGRGKD